jgi:hypothetical protein
MRGKPKHPLQLEILWAEAWAVLPPTELTPYDSLFEERRVEAVRYTFGEASPRPPEYHIELWAADLDLEGYSVEGPAAVCSTEQEARRAFEEAVAEMKKPLPRYFVKT